MKPKTKPKKRNYKRTIFILYIFALLFLASWFVVAPIIEKRKALDRQGELLTSIEQGDGTIKVDDAVINTPLDFYNDSGGEDETPNITETVTEENPSVIIFYEGNATAAPSAENGASDVITGIGVLTIEKIDAKLPVTDGVSDAQLKVAVGHVPQTAPIGNEGNAIIAGHRSYTYGQFFNRLGEVEPGDIIKYQPKGGGEMAFEVYETLTVLPDDPAVYADFPGEQILTLHTCTPVRVASHRLLVRAKRIY